MIVKMLGLKIAKSAWPSSFCKQCNRTTNQRVYATSSLGKQLRKLKKDRICSPTCLNNLVMDSFFSCEVALDSSSKTVLGLGEGNGIDLTDSCLDNPSMFLDGADRELKNSIVVRTSSIVDSTTHPHLLELTGNYGPTTRLIMSDSGLKEMIQALTLLQTKKE